MSKSDFDKMSRNLDTALDHVRAYRQRQDAIVLGLGDVRRELVAGYAPAALDELDDVLATTLKQAKDRVDNLLMALKVAVEALEKVDAGEQTASAVSDALSSIEIIAPKEMRAIQPVPEGSAS